MSEKKQPYSEIRCIQYPILFGGEAMDRINVFNVDFHSDNLPLRADIIRFGSLGFENVDSLASFIDDINEAIFCRPTLLCTDTINLDEDEWGGCIYFPHPPILK